MKNVSEPTIRMSKSAVYIALIIQSDEMHKAASLQKNITLNHLKYKTNTPLMQLETHHSVHKTLQSTLSNDIYKQIKAYLIDAVGLYDRQSCTCYLKERKATRLLLTPVTRSTMGGTIISAT